LPLTKHSRANFRTYS